MTFLLHYFNFIRIPLYPSLINLYYSPCPDENHNLLKLIKEHVTSLREGGTFYPTWYLALNHIQTIFGPLNIGKAADIKYDREMVILSDSGVVGLDWYPNKPTKEDKEPIVLILHGMGGGSHASYARDLAYQFYHPASIKPKFRSAVLNFRGCGSVPLATPKLYSAGDTSDIREVVEHLKHNFPNSKLYATGFSIGANLLCKYLGEAGDNSYILGACSISNPFDMVRCSRNMDRRTINRNLYTPFLARMLTKLFHTHHKVLSQAITPRYWSDVNAFEYDVTIMNPYRQTESYKFDTITQYYRESSCDQYLHAIKTKTLMINSKDDPISVYDAIAYDEVKANPNLILAVTDHGGHLGWWSNGTGSPKAASTWIKHPVHEFITALHSLAS